MGDVEEARRETVITAHHNTFESELVRAGANRNSSKDWSIASAFSEAWTRWYCQAASADPSQEDLASCDMPAMTVIGLEDTDSSRWSL